MGVTCGSRVWRELFDERIRAGDSGRYSVERYFSVALAGGLVRHFFDGTSQVARLLVEIALVKVASPLV